MVVAALLDHPEPSIRWRTRVRVLGEDPAAPEPAALAEHVRRSDRVRALLADVRPDGTVAGAGNVYAKWQGAHWILAALADIGYPPGDPALQPVADRVLDAWLAPRYYAEFTAVTRAAASRGSGVPVVDGRHRRCASQQANALWATLTLGLADERAGRLVERLLHWQWPDGGWNCDRNPAADSSSFVETVHCVRALHVYGEKHGDPTATDAAQQAAEVLLSRRLFKRRSTGEVIDPSFLLLHYPPYWPYGILFGLEVMAAAGLIGDERCADALDVLESKRLPDGGWPAEVKHYRVSAEHASRADYVDWGGSSKRRMNPWVTTGALAVLQAAGRWDGLAGNGGGGARSARHLHAGGGGSR